VGPIRGLNLRVDFILARKYYTMMEVINALAAVLIYNRTVLGSNKLILLKKIILQTTQTV
jgi:hypothetical protein